MSEESWREEPIWQIVSVIERTEGSTITDKKYRELMESTIRSHLQAREYHEEAGDLVGRTNVIEDAFMALKTGSPQTLQPEHVGIMRDVLAGRVGTHGARIQLPSVGIGSVPDFSDTAAYQVTEVIHGMDDVEVRGDGRPVLANSQSDREDSVS